MTHVSTGNLVARRRVLAVMVTAPALMMALWITALEMWRVREPQSSLFVTPFAYTLTEAIERDDVQRGYEFLRAGQDPSQSTVVRHAVLTDNRELLMPPMLWAVITNSPESLLMLLGHGARLDRPGDRPAACLALAFGHREIATLLTEYGDNASDDRCPDWDRAEWQRWIEKAYSP